MAIKNGSEENNNADKPKKAAAKSKPTPAKAKSTEEKVEAVARTARKTAVKVAAAVSDTVKDIAKKVTTRKTTTKTTAAKTPKAATSKTTATKKTSAAKTKSSTSAGALAADINSSDVNDAIKNSKSSSDILSEDSATDVKEHFFHDQHAQQGPPPPQAPRDLPDEYGDTKLVLLVRDPEWAYAYWELNDNIRNTMDIPRNGNNKRITLRLFKVTGRDWPQEPAHYFFDVEVDRNAVNWYMRLPEPNEAWCAELGILDDHHNFTPIVRSNQIITPRNTISDQVDSEWMTVEESFEKITRLSGAGASIESRLRGDSSAGSEAIIRQINKQLTGVLHGERPNMSSGIFSSESALPRSNKRFRLQVNTELILYGATEPDATVTVQGKTIPLNPDGTFSLRFALPDGEQILDVKAVNVDGDMEETVTPIVTRTTN